MKRRELGSKQGYSVH